MIGRSRFLGWVAVAGLSAIVAPVSSAFAAVELDAGIQSLASALAGQMRGKGIQKLAVVDFSDIRGYPSALDAYLAEELITQLFSVAPGEFSIVERRQLSRVLEEQKINASMVFDQKAIAEVGKILGLNAIVTGSIADLGDAIKINARSISVESGLVFASAGAEIAKEGRVAELLRQTAGPGRGPASASAPAARQVQSTDVFFENKLLRVTVASVGVAPGRRRATVALQVENLSAEDLKLSLMQRNATFGCAAGLSDDSGNHSLVDPHKVSGVSCTNENELEIRRNGGRYAPQGSVDENWPVLASRSRSTVVLPFEVEFSSREQRQFGRIFSLGLELYVSRGGKVEKLSIGLSNIVAPETPSE